MFFFFSQLKITHTEYSRKQMEFTHPLSVESLAFVILSLGGLHYVDLR